MAGPGGIFLTGATGFLGQYLLRELLRLGVRVAVLVRERAGESAEERIHRIAEPGGSGIDSNRAKLQVIRGDLRWPGLGISATDRAWVTKHCDAVIHTAACVTFRRTHGGEPWSTNREGTRRVLDFCAEAGLREIHYVSTAFVCGNRTGTILEAERDCGQSFQNEYEKSKFEAERLVLSETRTRATIYRPSVIVGSSTTGHTSSYHGFYRFLELADRLATRKGQGRKRSLPLRLPFTGNESRNLVPVDWVSRAIARIVTRPEFHGETYHLTSSHPVRFSLIQRVAERELDLADVKLVGTDPPGEWSSLERAFVEGLSDYWTYLERETHFDDRNTRRALPDLPVPIIDSFALTRLIRFARTDQWGRRKRTVPCEHRVNCSRYIEGFFPNAIRESALMPLPITATLGFDIHGEGGGRWLFRLREGHEMEIVPGTRERADVEYVMDVDTFSSIVSGQRSPQSAFFGRNIEIQGDVEKGLKLAVLFEQFTRELPYRPFAERGRDVAA